MGSVSPYWGVQFPLEGGSFGTLEDRVLVLVSFPSHEAGFSVRWVERWCTVGLGLGVM